MTKAYLVARNEYLGTVRTKAFWIGLLAFPVVIALAAVVPRLLHQAKDIRTYAVVDESGFLLREIDVLIYERDLTDLIAAAAAWKRAGGPGGQREFERLPDAVRELTLAWMELDEQERAGFVHAWHGGRRAGCRKGGRGASPTRRGATSSTNGGGRSRPAS